MVDIVNVKEAQFAPEGRKVGVHNNIGTVSYTHLDVYKRQGYTYQRRQELNYYRLRTQSLVNI